MKKDQEEFLTLQEGFMESCEMPLEETKIEPFIMVIFGGTGNLSRRKLLPAVYNLFVKKKLPENFYILGIGSRDISDEDYRSIINDSITEFAKDNSHTSISAFISHLSYLSNDANNKDDYSEVCRKIEFLKKQGNINTNNVIYYLAVPPSLLPNIVNKLNQVNACNNIENSKIVIEKPFGRDRYTAVELNKLVSNVFKENQVYRIDHYLGKDTVQNIMFFRFGNSIFEPLWNRKYIDNVRIIVSEDLGIENRGKFYEQSGIVRDIIQNHMMQLIALVAMEPPVGFGAEFIREERVKVLKTFRPLSDKYIDKYMIRGQYGPGEIDGIKIKGYRQEDNVNPKSNVPTFFAGKFFIDNWRWSGVPFYVAAGKRMKMKSTEIIVQFKQPPLRLFGRTCDVIEPNLLIIRIQPEEKIFFRVNVKAPGIHNKQHPVHMHFDYDEIEKTDKYPAYERLILDAIKGDQTLFARQDGIEAMWNIVDPIINRWEKVPVDNFPNYDSGTWGPEEAEELVKVDCSKWSYK